MASLQVRERATASLVHKGVLLETSNDKPVGAATLHYAASLFDPTHSSATYKLGQLGAATKGLVVSQMQAILTGHSDSTDLARASTERQIRSQQQRRLTTARNVVLCVLARYSDVVHEVTEQWGDEERRQAGERLSKLTYSELAPEVDSLRLSPSPR